MSEAENLLNQVSDDGSSTDSINTVTEEHIVIGADRFITVPESLKRIAVQYDHNIETVTFDCPRFWDDIDMSAMKVYINYMRADKVLGQYPVETVTTEPVEYYPVVYDHDDEETLTPYYLDPTYDTSIEISLDGDKTRAGFTLSGQPVYLVTGADNTPIYYVEHEPNLMHFDWVISRNVTEVAGRLSFLVCIKTTNDEEIEIAHWNSELNQDLFVSEGLEVDEVISSLHADVITTILLRMDTIDANIKNEVTSTISQMITDGVISGVDLTGYISKDEASDYIVERGEIVSNYSETAENAAGEVGGLADTTWTYEKYNSGICKFWGTLSFNSSFLHVDTSTHMAYSGGAIDIPAPFLNTDELFIQSSLRSNIYTTTPNTLSHVIISITTSGGVIPNCGLSISTPGDVVNSGNISLYLIGKWK